MSQLAFYVNTDACVTCKACGIACKDKNDLKPGRKFRRIFSQSFGSWSFDENGATMPNGVFSYSLSVGCNHCELPACFAVCPTTAIIKRDDGIVYIDQELCIGCGECAKVCPYDVPSFDVESSKMNKCDFCMDLLDEGKVPVCVAACLMNALDYGELDDLKAKYPGAVQQAPPLPDPVQTSPSLLITTHRNYKPGSTTTNFNMPEEIRANE
jgi:anaerobic dimethyl sulfoxide reductase subunit B (iron-sulfur subunit)